MHLGITDFFQDVGNFFKGGTVLGVDIGTASIHAVELSKKGDSLNLVNYGTLGTKRYLEYSNQAIQTSSLKVVPKDTARLLSILVREMRLKTNIAVASLPLFSSFITVLNLPLFSQEETAKAVMFQAQQYIPLSPKEVSVEWKKIEEFENQREQKFQRILLTGIPNEVIARHKEIFKAAGLRLMAMEIETFALARAFGSFFTDVPVLMVDIGAESTGVAVVEKGNIMHVEQTDYSGVYLTKALSKSLDISMPRAEELKRRRGLSSVGADSELSTLLLPFLDVIIQEVRHVKDAYSRQYKRDVGKVMLAGGEANLIGIEKYVASQLGLPIAHHPLFTGVSHPSSIEPAVRALENEFAIAFGLAKKYFE